MARREVIVDVRKLVRIRVIGLKRTRWLAIPLWNLVAWITQSTVEVEIGER